MRLAEGAGGPVDFAAIRPQVRAYVLANPQLLNVEKACRAAENSYIESRSITGWAPNSGIAQQLALRLPIAPDNLIALSDDRQRIYQRASIATYDQALTHRTVRENAVKRMLDTHNAALAELDEALQNWRRPHRYLRDVWRDLYGYTGP